LRTPLHTKTMATNSTNTITRPSLYEADFYAWTQEQVSLLRQHQWSELDLLNLIEEIESLGKQLIGRILSPGNTESEQDFCATRTRHDHTTNLIII